MIPRALSINALLAALAGCVDYSFGDEDPEVEPDVYATEAFSQAASPKVDVLWIVDNTGSMAEEQAALAEGFGAFIEALDAHALAYQVGVITTDMTADAGLLQGNPWIITPELDDPESAFAAAVDVGTESVGDEAGLAALVAALSEPLRSGDNRGFRRPDAVLHAIAVSDADDASAGWLDDPVAEAEALLAAEAQASGLPAFLSAVVCDDPGGCACEGGGAGVPGLTWIEVAEATGGVVSGICEGDLLPVVAALGELSVTLGDTFYLSATPHGDPQVWVDGERAEGGWAVLDDPPRLVFAAPPPAGALVEIRYQLPPAGG